MILAAKYRNVAIVGITRETTSILSQLLEIQGIRIVRIVNPEVEDLRELERYQFLDVIINATDSHEVAEMLKQLRFEKIDIISGLSARILFLSGGRGIGQTTDLDQERTRILNSLHEIKQAVLLSKNKEEFLKLFLEVAIGSCGADSGSIMLVEPQKRFLKIEMADGLNVDVVRSTEQKFGKGVAGKVARTGKPVLLTGPVGREEHSDGKERPDLVSAISCPMQIGPEIVGVININSKNKYRIFNQADLKYVEDLSHFAADVIKASKEFEMTSSSAFSLSLMGSAQAILDLDFPFEERLNLLLMKIANSSGGVICNYYEYDEEKRRFYVKASSSFNMNLLRGKKIKLNGYITKEVLKDLKTISLQTPDLNSAQRRWYIAHPIRLQKRLVGLLFLHLISIKEDMTEEQKIVARIGEMIAHEFNKNAEMQFLKMQSTKLSAVSEASFNIASSTNVKELINFALPYACLIMEAEAGVFWFLNPVTDRLEIYKSFSIEDQYARLKRIEELDAVILDKTVPSDEVLLVEDLRQEGVAVGKEYPHSLLSKTFGRGTQIAGVLSLYGKKSLDLYGSRSFTEQDKEVFLKFCLQLFKGLANLMPYFDEKR